MIERRHLPAVLGAGVVLAVLLALWVTRTDTTPRPAAPAPVAAGPAPYVSVRDRAVQELAKKLGGVDVTPREATAEDLEGLGDAPVTEETQARLSLRRDLIDAKMAFDAKRALARLGVTSDPRVETLLTEHRARLDELEAAVADGRLAAPEAPAALDEVRRELEDALDGLGATPATPADPASGTLPP